jgi:hypothetical protein
MSYVVAIIGPGARGSGIGTRLRDNGVEVRTSLKGRSDAAKVRAQAAGMDDVEDALIASSVRKAFAQSATLSRRPAPRSSTPPSSDFRLNPAPGVPQSGRTCCSHDPVGQPCRRRTRAS